MAPTGAHSPRRAEQREGCSRRRTQPVMNQSPALAEALVELELYDDTDEAEAGFALLAAFDLDEIDVPAVH